jgi:hypothetical protein
MLFKNLANDQQYFVSIVIVPFPDGGEVEPSVDYNRQMVTLDILKESSKRTGSIGYHFRALKLNFLQNVGAKSRYLLVIGMFHTKQLLHLTTVMP